VPKNTPLSDIKKAYYKLAKQYHPDSNPSPQAKVKFEEISEAYEILADENKRKLYDSCGYGDEADDNDKEEGENDSKEEGDK